MNAILKYSNLNIKYWPYTIKTVVNIKNNVPHKGINNKLLNMEWYGPNSIKYEKK